MTHFCLALFFALIPIAAVAQQSEAREAGGDAATAPMQTAALTATAYTPITDAGRVVWIVDGTIGKRSLGVGVLAGLWQSGFKIPSEWERTWGGFGKRYAQREVDVAISSSIEAGLGALWGEDPRYIRSGRRGIWPRARYALKTVMLAQRRDGRLAPAWGRYAGNTLNNLVENAWLPPSQTTIRGTTIRCATGFLGRAAGNLWDEFWPDARRLLSRKPRASR